eukprot:GEMP01047207.1.p1 GENE.GEMP01047207.1~~GEMP01047207.1.p1  ORF type:complete len:269 (+),score=46.66 GEMP01047207.1:563-1369(+)
MNKKHRTLRFVSSSMQFSLPIFLNFYRAFNQFHQFSAKYRTDALHVHSHASSSRPSSSASSCPVFPHSAAAVPQQSLPRLLSLAPDVSPPLVASACPTSAQGCSGSPQGSSGCPLSPTSGPIAALSPTCHATVVHAMHRNTPVELCATLSSIQQEYLLETYANLDPSAKLAALTKVKCTLETLVSIEERHQMNTKIADYKASLSALADETKEITRQDADARIHQQPRSITSYRQQPFSSSGPSGRCLPNCIVMRDYEQKRAEALNRLE